MSQNVYEVEVNRTFSIFSTTFTFQKTIPYAIVIFRNYALVDNLYRKAYQYFVQAFKFLLISNLFGNFWGAINCLGMIEILPIRHMAQMITQFLIVA